MSRNKKNHKRKKWSKIEMSKIRLKDRVKKKINKRLMIKKVKKSKHDKHNY